MTGVRADILESIQKNTPEDENNFFVNVVRAESIKRSWEQFKTYLQNVEGFLN